jgi:outer membrane protein
MHARLVYRRPPACLALLGLTAAAIAVVALAGGCQVNQAKEVAHYRKVLDDNRLPAAPVQDEAADAEATRPLTLAEAMALANKQNEQLGRSGEDYVQSLIDKNRAVANFLPTVSVQPAYTIQHRSGNNGGNSSVIVDPNGGGTSSTNSRDNPSQTFTVPIVGAINVFRGFGDVANLHAAEATIAQRRDLLLDLQATVLLNVAQTYYQVLRSERSAEVLRTSVQVQEARLHDVTIQQRSGIVNALTVSQAKAQLADTRVQLTQAISDARNARTLLAQLIGRHDVPNPLLDDYAVPGERSPVADFEAAALETRQDVAAAVRARESARQAVEVAFAQYYPSVDVNLRDVLYHTGVSSTVDWSAVLRANIPIFSAGVIEADVRTAWSKFRQAVLDESAARRQVVADVHTSYENLVTAERRITDLEQEVQSADDAYRLARKGFASGLGTNLEVLVAQQQLLNSQLALTSARFDRTVFYLDLCRAGGNLVERVAQRLPTTQPTTGPTTGPTTTTATTTTAPTRPIELDERPAH